MSVSATSTAAASEAENKCPWWPLWLKLVVLLASGISAVELVIMLWTLFGEVRAVLVVSQLTLDGVPTEEPIAFEDDFRKLIKNVVAIEQAGKQPIWAGSPGALQELYIGRPSSGSACSKLVLTRKPPRQPAGVGGQSLHVAAKGGKACGIRVNLKSGGRWNERHLQPPGELRLEFDAPKQRAIIIAEHSTDGFHGARDGDETITGQVRAVWADQQLAAQPVQYSGKTRLRELTVVPVGANCGPLELSAAPVALCFEYTSRPIPPEFEHWLERYRVWAKYLGYSK
ncbi:MAG TPA: hypothetical protein VI072_03865 [Polyangiaceae bacterium]